MPDRQVLSKKARQRAFLASYRAHGVISEACRRTGISRQLIYQWIDRDAAFKAAMAEADEEVTEAAELALFQRAVDGVTQERPVFAKGAVVGTISTTEYSDRLLMFMLAARRPLVYGTQRHDITTGGQPLIKAYTGVDLEDV